MARDWADQYVAEIPGVRGKAQVGGTVGWAAMALAISNQIVPTLTPPGTLCFLGGMEQICLPVEGVSAVSRTAALCSRNVVLDPDIVFYDVPAASGPQKGKSLRTVDDEAIAKGNAANAESRRRRRKAYEDIGAALRPNKVMAVEILAIDAVVDMSIAKQLCADWGVMVGGYKKPITLTVVDGNARLFFTGDAPGDGSNTWKAEKDVPPFDKSAGFLLRKESNGTITQVV
jgi:hypothetical protein